MTKLENNLLMPIVLGVLASVVLHWRMPGRWVRAWLLAATCSAILWFALLSAADKAISNLWPIALAFWTVFELPVCLITGIAFIGRAKFPAAPHLCQSCGYDLTGNISGTCPECGTKR